VRRLPSPSPHLAPPPALPLPPPAAGPQWWYSDLPARVQAWRGAGLKVLVDAMGRPPAGWLAAYQQYFVDSGWEDKTPRAARRVTEWPPEAHPPGEEAAAAENAALTGSELSVATDGAAAPAAAAAEAVPAKERDFLPLLGAARRAASHSTPHWYSVRPHA
jgi:hypothetical protein